MAKSLGKRQTIWGKFADEFKLWRDDPSSFLINGPMPPGVAILCNSETVIIECPRSAKSRANAEAPTRIDVAIAIAVVLAANGCQTVGAKKPSCKKTGGNHHLT